MEKPMLKKSPQDTIDQSTLPDWDLSHLFKGITDPQIDKDLDWAEKEAKTFREEFFSKVDSLDGNNLAAAIKRLEDLEEKLGKVMTFTVLLHQTRIDDVAVGQFYQKIREKMTDISSPLIFFTLELNLIDEGRLTALYDQSDALVGYKSWIDNVRLYKNHQLTDEMERLLNEKSIIGSSAWSKLYEETLADIRFPFQDKELTCTEILNILSDRDEAKRKEAAESVGQTLGKNIKIFTTITNTLAKDKEINDRWRQYPHMVSSRNLANQVEDEVVEALTETVKEHYSSLSHRYYKLKAKWFGGDKLQYYNRNAPLPEDEDKLITWQESTDIILEAYGEFSPEMAKIGKRFFDENWIDAKVYPGKTSGAFSHPCVPSSHPYILVNYLGKARDVATVAHELGHGVHQVLASEQGYFKSSTPLTLAETASVFGEMLTFQKLLSRKTNPAARKIMLASKVDDMLNTVVRQISFFEFEKKVHAGRRKGSLTPDQIGEFWLEVSKESLGPALVFDESYKNFWAYISHFIHTPFYVYAYAFGDCLVNSLYAVYQQDVKAGKKDEFAAKYMDLLRAGGTKRHTELLAPFGLDASKKSFWQQGLSMIESLITEIEEIEKNES